MLATPSSSELVECRASGSSDPAEPVELVEPAELVEVRGLLDGLARNWKVALFIVGLRLEAAL